MIGTTLNNRYRLDEELGVGGMGFVYRAQDILLDRAVAVKLISESGLGTEGRNRLLREAQSAAQLNHPNIVSVYDAGEAEGRPFIVMELVDGKSLYSRRPESVEQVISVALQICAALEHAHSHGIIHRDVKPENVLRKADGKIKLTDFGLARSVASRLTVEGGISGTAFYLAPEQALGRQIDGRTDLYALGVMLYELTAGRLPFTGDDLLTVISQHLHAPVVPPSTHNPDIPPALDALILQLLSKLPEDRPSSATEVARILSRLAAVSEKPLPEAAGKLSMLDQLVRGRMVGRESEFAEARMVWHRAISEFGQVLLVSGETGIGKTRFVDELTTLVQVQGGQALYSQCYAEGGAPYAPFTQVLRGLFGDRPEEIGRLGLPDLVLDELFSLAPDLRICCPDLSPNPPLDPQAERQRLFEGVLALCTALAERAPLLLVVEDVHWADGGTLSLLRQLSRRLRSLRLLIMLTYREIELDQAHGLNELLLELSRERVSTRIKLGRLDRDQTGQMLAVMFGDEITDEFLTLIYRETEGNPFFIEEVCKALIEDGRIYRENGVWQRANVEEIQIPQSVRLAIQSRLTRLPPFVQDLLLLASIFGREFDFSSLREACDLDEEALVDALETAERAQLISEAKRAGQGESFIFVHALIPTTLRESVSGLRRHRLHRRVAAAIERVHPDDLEALAYHYGEAGDEKRARTYVLRAAERARRLYANEEAIRFYSEALELLPRNHPDRFDLLAARSEVYELVAQREAQRADVEEMLALAEAQDDDARRFDALIAQVDFYLATERSRARELARRAVAIAESLQDPVREGQALRRQGYDALLRLDYTQSRRILETSAARFRDANLGAEAAVSLHTLSLALGYLGEHAAAQKAVEEAIALSQQAGDRRQEAISLRRLAIVYLHQNEYAQALPFAEQALSLHRELGDRLQECHALNVLGLVLAWLGQAQEAKAHLDQSLELAEALGSDTAFSNAIDNLLWLHYYWQGAFEKGLAFLERQLSKPHVLDKAFLSGMLHLRRGQFMAHLGQYGPALEIIRPALPVLEQAQGQAFQAAVLAFIGQLQAELGSYAQARQNLNTALGQFEGSGRPVDTAGVLISLAYVALREGGAENLRQGLEWARQAIALLRGTEWILDLGRSLHIAAQLHLELGQIDEAWVISTGALRLAAKWPFVSQDFLFAHFRVLWASGREEESTEYLRRACERVTDVANQTRDRKLRQSWLENIWFNRQILEEAAARGMVDRKKD